MTPDTDPILLTPKGHKFNLVLIAVMKRVLTTCQVSAAERLALLEDLNGFVDQFLTAEALAAVEPANDTFADMVIEARKLERGDDPAGMASYRMLTRPDVFGHLMQLNPSLVRAMRICASRSARA